MPDQKRERPTTNEYEADVTGRDRKMAPERVQGAPASKLEKVTGLDADDAAGDGIDSADFPGAGSP